ncbi:putative orphan protein [Pseudoalteromonas translucida]|uniref:Orphan protein n=1 Tax=Pseudoalteromonas translucida (strain TAC 125) TaxID=326442 RepID=Q3IG25_PSET1|nr:putative orphan protein [Pseudoalteromonas translucida]
MRRSQVARLYEGIERNVAGAGVYQHFYCITTGGLFFPQIF